MAQVQTYLDLIQCDAASRACVDRYLHFISLRASGALLTNAAWIRQFVKSHPDYKRDSVVSDSVNADLLATAWQVAKGSIEAVDLLPDFVVHGEGDEKDVSSCLHHSHDAHTSRAETSEGAHCKSTPGPAKKPRPTPEQEPPVPLRRRTSLRLPAETECDRFRSFLALHTSQAQVFQQASPPPRPHTCEG